MKNSSPLIHLIKIMLLMALSCSLSYQQSNAGGADGGGGNAGIIESASDKEIVELIQTLPLYLPPILYSHYFKK